MYSKGRIQGPFSKQLRGRAEGHWEWLLLGQVPWFSDLVTNGNPLESFSKIGRSSPHHRGSDLIGLGWGLDILILEELSRRL